MEEKYFFISEVSKMVGAEPHVLRYWEEELHLKIQRNGQGKRCYTQEDVEQFCRIKYWRDKGMQLKAVREMMEGEQWDKSAPQKRLFFTDGSEKEGVDREEGTEPERIPSELVTIEEPSDSMKRFEEILDGIIGQALERNNEKLVREICDTILQELDDRLEERLEELLQKEQLREMVQEGEREAAASALGPKEKESIWKKWRRRLEKMLV